MAEPILFPSRAERQTYVAAAYTKGESQASIAARLGLNRVTILKDLQRAGVQARGPATVEILAYRFGTLTVVDSVRRSYACDWLCYCDCGGECVADASALRRGKIVKCGLCRSPDVAPETKECRDCGETFVFTEENFPVNAQHPFGLRVICRDCRNNKARGPARDYLLSVRLEVLTHYSKGTLRCVCCGLASHHEFLTLDHIHGGGHAERQEWPGGRLWFKLRREGFPEGYRTLCFSCNLCRGHFRYCPHVDERPDVLSYGRTYPDKVACLTHYSGGTPRCECCGEKEFDFLSVGSSNGQGSMHILLRRRGFPVEYQGRAIKVLCFNCSLAASAHGVCPHQNKG